MREIKDGEILTTGKDVLMLESIRFTGATVRTKQGDEIMVVLTLSTQSDNQPNPACIQLLVRPRSLAYLAKLFQDNADQLARNTTPKAPLQ